MEVDKLDLVDLEVDLEDPEVDKAATKIQSCFKGRKARIEVEAMKKAKEAEEKVEVTENDINLDDEEVQEAARKIQTAFRSSKLSRKNI